MKANKLGRFWVSITIVLVALIIVGGVVALLRYSPSRAIEISMPVPQNLGGQVYIGGAVIAPGLYPFGPDDNLDTLLQAAGGTNSKANLSELALYVPEPGQGQEPQKVDINRAEVWLLEALPEVGEILAQRIIDYRQQNGPFRNTSELMKVAGIGDATYQRIKDLITIRDY
jgi:competence protein ComEA